MKSRLIISLFLAFACSLACAQQPQTPPVEVPPVIAPPVVVKPNADDPVVPTPDPLTKPFAIVATSRSEVLGDLIAKPEVGHLLELTLDGLPADAGPVFFTYSDVIPDRSERDSGKWVGLTFPPETAGKAYLVQAAVNSESGKPPLVAMRWLVVSGKGPQPPPVVDPVDPVQPDVKPVPTPSKDFRVLIYEETTDRGNLTAPQRAIFTAKAIRDYMTANGVKTNGQADGFRVFDDDSDLSLESAEWRAMATEAKKFASPNITVARNGVLKTYQFPANVDEALSIIQGAK